MRLLTLLACSAIGFWTLPAAAFWNPFSAAPPEVSARYDPTSCTGVGKILAAIRNPTGEPLASYRLAVRVFKPQRSSVMSEFTYRSDYVIQANSQSNVCLDVRQDDVVGFLNVETPGASAWELAGKYGSNWFQYQGREFLQDAVIQIEVTEFEYGLPY